MKPITSSGLDTNPLLVFDSADPLLAFDSANPLLAFDSEGSAQALSDHSSFDRTVTRSVHESGLIRQLETESKLRTLFDVFVGLAAAVGFGLALQETSQSFGHPMRRSMASAEVVAADVATRLESHPIATSFEPLRSGVPAEATTEVVDAIEFDRCEIDVQGALAVASCQGSARSLSGNGARRWRFNLRKVNNAWQIQEVDSR